MYSELIAVPSNGGERWHITVTQPYMWRVEFACDSESTAIALKIALNGVTDAIFEPMGPGES